MPVKKVIFTIREPSKSHPHAEYSLAVTRESGGLGICLVIQPREQISHSFAL